MSGESPNGGPEQGAVTEDHLLGGRVRLRQRDRRREAGVGNPHMPTRPLLFGTFLTSQSIVSQASVASSTALGSPGWTAVERVKMPPDLNRPRIDWKTKT